MKKAILKDSLILLCITLVAGLCLSFVYELTKEPIAKAELEAKAKSYRTVYTQAAQFAELDEAQRDKLVQINAETTAEVNEVLLALDDGGNVIGYVMSVTSKNGYAGEIKVALGVANNGSVTGFAPLSHGESPGFGARCADEDIKQKFVGITSSSGFDGISGATITSNALRETVDAALTAVAQIKG